MYSCFSYEIKNIEAGGFENSFLTTFKPVVTLDSGRPRISGHLSAKHLLLEKSLFAHQLGAKVEKHSEYEYICDALTFLRNVSLLIFALFS